MSPKQILAVSMVMVFASTLPAVGSISLQPLNSQLNISWDMDDGSPVFNGSAWFFSVLEPPSSNDAFAFQAVGQLTGASIIQDNNSGAGSTTPFLDGMDNGNGTITWEANYLPSAVAFKFGRDWYSVWSTDMATFDVGTGLWSETITIGQAPQGSLSHTSTQLTIIPEPGTFAIGSSFGALGYLVFAFGCARKNTRVQSL